MLGTTKLFLDYFDLKQLDDLPPLADLSDWESLRVQLNLPEVEEEVGEAELGAVTDLPVIPTEDDEVVNADSLDDTDIAEALPESALDPEVSAEASNKQSADVPVLSPDTVAELTRDHGFEEIVATEWPEPDASDEPDGDKDPEDVDASASRG